MQSWSYQLKKWAQRQLVEARRAWRAHLCSLMRHDWETFLHPKGGEQVFPCYCKRCGAEALWFARMRTQLLSWDTPFLKQLHDAPFYTFHTGRDGDGWKVRIPYDVKVLRDPKPFIITSIS